MNGNVPFPKSCCDFIVRDINLIINIWVDEQEKSVASEFNAIQVDGYDPCTITDFEIPKKYGLRQTIADTVGIGGIFRNLRMIPLLNGLITNLPNEACVEVPCLVDRRGISPTYTGDLPPQLAALNRTNLNTQLLTIEAAVVEKKTIYTMGRCLIHILLLNCL